MRSVLASLALALVFVSMSASIFPLPSNCKVVSGHLFCAAPLPHF